MVDPDKSLLPESMPLNVFIQARMRQLPDVTNVMVAEALGYPRPNVIAMLRQGSMKLPISKVPALAQVLEVDPAALLRAVLREYEPAALEVIESTLGAASLLSESEVALVRFVRHQLSEHDVPLVGELATERALAGVLSERLQRHMGELLASRAGDDGVRKSHDASAARAWRELLRKQMAERAELQRSLGTVS